MHQLCKVLILERSFQLSYKVVKGVVGGKGSIDQILLFQFRTQSTAVQSDPSALHRKESVKNTFFLLLSKLSS